MTSISLHLPPTFISIHCDGPLLAEGQLALRVPERSAYDTRRCFLLTQLSAAAEAAAVTDCTDHRYEYLWYRQALSQCLLGIRLVF